ncbi:putative T-complex protein 1 subunit alpha-like [Apostichopus japonicus]|uniref:T-complex protein 1 subunit alpha n=1 Tax=Stichopus japonicus TaxID=307972 RepID=A0A2G8JQQ4_STIJA|nr:putative T-complex protein 1 subunit alpha-like [Apostichopus japonicus]
MCLQGSLGLRMLCYCTRKFKMQGFMPDCRDESLDLLLDVFLVVQVLKILVRILLSTAKMMAASSIANIVKSSLGPVGLDKMLVDDVGDVTVTNDGATILKLLEVEHPSAKILVELADLQDQEVGDGTTSVVLIAAELLKNADELVKQKIHPTTIISGYRLACKFNHC